MAEAFGIAGHELAAARVCRPAPTQVNAEQALVSVDPLYPGRPGVERMVRPNRCGFDELRHGFGGMRIQPPALWRSGSPGTGHRVSKRPDSTLSRRRSRCPHCDKPLRLQSRKMPK
jgi:hypothetical protein